jgi:uncharacterized membrane protein (DUF485 family)
LNDGPVPIPLEARNRLLSSHAFRRLVTRRWRTSLLLTLLLFVLYYGYILLIAFNKPLLAVRGDRAPRPTASGTMRPDFHVPLGIPLGAAVILGSWVLTAAYVVWANRHYDPEVTRLRASLSSAGDRPLT